MFQTKTTKVFFLSGMSVIICIILQGILYIWYKKLHVLHYIDKLCIRAQSRCIYFHTHSASLDIIYKLYKKRSFSYKMTRCICSWIQRRNIHLLQPTGTTVEWHFLPGMRFSVPSLLMDGAWFIVLIFQIIQMVVKSRLSKTAEVDQYS